MNRRNRSVHADTISSVIREEIGDLLRSTPPTSGPSSQSATA